MVARLLSMARVEQFRVPGRHRLTASKGRYPPSNAAVALGHVVRDHADRAKLSFVSGSCAPLLRAGPLQERDELVVGGRELPREGLRAGTHARSSERGG